MTGSATSLGTSCGKASLSRRLLACSRPRDSMKPALSFLGISVIAAALVLCSSASRSAMKLQEKSAPRAYLGFDLNIFPGSAALPVLRKNFSFSGYWLSPPPGEKANTWRGKRELLEKAGFGFLLLYRGRQSADLKSEADAIRKGTLDARNAASNAKSEGFTPKSVLFLDIEEGGRLPVAYYAYLHAWTTELIRLGYRAGAYCSGIPVKEEGGVTITTADDIRSHFSSQDFVFFIYNDACPPSPGCVFPEFPPPPSASGTPYAEIWQFAQSPKRKELAAHCPPGYNADGNCYALGDTARAWFIDVSTASTPNPSDASK